MKPTRTQVVTCASLLAAALTVSVVAFAMSKGKGDKWAELDQFKSGLPTKLASSTTSAGAFDIQALGQKLSSMRIDEMPVCVQEEISADQYIELAEVAESIQGNQKVMLQLNRLLDSEAGLSDCQFRVLTFATARPANSSK